MIIKPNQYIFPPRAKDAIPREETGIFKQLGWIAQLKYNDSRAMIKYCQNGNIELWNRHAERFRTYNAPDWLLDQLKTLGHRLGIKPGLTTILDGGLLDQKHQAIKDSIVIWDILAYNDEYLVGTILKNRFNQLLAAATQQPWIYEHPSHEPKEFGLKLTDNVYIPHNLKPETWDEAWDMVYTVNAPWTKPGENTKPVLEGLMFKDPNGKLELGFSEKNNSNWQFRSRVETGRHKF